jgi:hypothetical protein
LLAHAQSRPGNNLGAREALRSYLGFLNLAESQFRRLGIDVPPGDLHEDVLSPSLRIAADLQNDPQVKPLVASLQGMYGHFVARNTHIFTDLRIREAAKTNLRQALALDSSNPTHRCNLAMLLLSDARADERALAEVRNLAAEAQQQASQDAFVRLVTERVEGETWYWQSVIDAEAKDRLNAARKAEAAFTEALNSNLDQWKNEVGLKRQAAVHRADALIGRSASLVLQANYLPQADRAAQLALLDRAIVDASEAIKTDDPRTQYYAFLAYGHALEDRAWLCSVPQDYDTAIQAYDLAEKTRGYSPEPCIGRARCWYKAEVFGGKDDGVEKALRELAYVSETFRADELSQSDVHCLTAKAYVQKGDLVAADEEYRKAWEVLKIKGLGEETLRKTACLQDWGNCCLQHAHKLLLSTDRSTVAQWAGMAIFCADSLKGVDVVRANLLRAKALGYQAKVATTDPGKLQQQALDLYNATEKLADLSQKARFELYFQRAELKRELGQRDEATIKDYDTALTMALTADERAAARGGGGLTRMDLGRTLLRQGQSAASTLQINESARQLKEAIAEAPAHPASNSWRLMLAARLLRGAPKNIRDERADEIRKMLVDGMATSTESMRNDFETLRQEFNRHFPAKRI